MIKVYVVNKLDGIPYLPVLTPNLGPVGAGGLFAERSIAYLKNPVLEMVENPSDADYILIPHNYFYALKRRPEYLRECVRLAEKAGKNLILFAYGDSDEEIPFPDAIIFRSSQYRYKKKKNEIMMPAYVEDLGMSEFLAPGVPRAPRPLAIKPVVGFCGWAAFSSWRNAVKTYVKAYVLTYVSSVGRPEVLAKKKGLLFRKEILAILRKSKNIEPNFIIRDFYSHHKATIKIPPEQARREYVENILGSDLSLAVKGDGNYSLRFYEILSLGRVPVLIDTDCVLPLEHVIAYDEFILRIPYRDISRSDEIITDFWGNLTEEKFAEMQKKAREAFEKYLRIDAFFRYVFKDKETLESALAVQ